MVCVLYPVHNDITYKKCTSCGYETFLYSFCKNRSKKGGLDSRCKKCKSEHDKGYKDTHKKEIADWKKEHYKNNKKEINARNKKHREENAEKIFYQRKKYRSNNLEKEAARKKKWCEDNPEKMTTYRREYYQNNKEKILFKTNAYTKERSKKDINFKLARNLRSRLGCAIKGSFKAGSAVRDLGCSISFLKEYLKSLFAEGMTWNNWGYGKNKWNIDHIIPLSSFNLTNREQLLKACHYTNLQPLWQSQNLLKGDKLNWEKRVA